MSKRLQVLLDPKEWRVFAQIAKKDGISLGEWVRQSLRKAARANAVIDPSERIKRLRLISTYSNGPTGDIEKMLEEIERGRK